MKRILPALALPLALAACGIPQLAAIGTHAALSPATVATLTTICRHGEPLVVAAANPAMPGQVQDIGSFVAAYCSQLLAGQVPATTDGNTASWLEQNLGALRGVLSKP
jgi:hypothetical protein